MNGRLAVYGWSPLKYAQIDARFISPSLFFICTQSYFDGQVFLTPLATEPFDFVDKHAFRNILFSLPPPSSVKRVIIKFVVKEKIVI